MKKPSVRNVKKSKVTRANKLKSKLKSLKLPKTHAKKKTHSGAKDRLLETAGGKLMRRHAAVNHFQSKQTDNNQRAKKGVSQLSGGMKKKHKKAL